MNAILCVACLPLTGPINGDINCSLGADGQPSLGDTCTFTCDDDYELTGSVSRSCMIDGSWSGNETMCTVGMHIYLRIYFCIT